MHVHTHKYYQPTLWKPCFQSFVMPLIVRYIWTAISEQLFHWLIGLILCLAVCLHTCHDCSPPPMFCNSEPKMLQMFHLSGHSSFILYSIVAQVSDKHPQPVVHSTLWDHLTHPALFHNLTIMCIVFWTITPMSFLHLNWQWKTEVRKWVEKLVLYAHSHWLSPSETKSAGLSL